MRYEICIVDAHGASLKAASPNSTTLKKRKNKPAAAGFLLAAEDGRGFTLDNDPALLENSSWGVTFDSRADPLV